ncbi:MAG: Fic family protein [Phycisphaerae bacterium]|nr:Fic family protein [Phycisphaerae bacterium]
MRIPKTPPTLKEAWRTFSKSPQRAVESHVFQQGPTYNGKYYHWQKLQYLQPPEKLDIKELWYAMKIARSAGAKQLPLKDLKGCPFVFNIPECAQEDIFQIDQTAAGRLKGSELIVDPTLRDQYIFRSLAGEAIASSKLEGAKTAHRIAREMLRADQRPQNLDERMISNNYRTIRQVREWKAMPLSPAMVLELHRLVTEGTLPKADAAGRLRNRNEPIEIIDTTTNEVLHTPPSPEELESRLQLMCDFANAKTPGYFIHPLIRATILHFWLAYDHPFIDGNGRCARALFHWLMGREDYWISDFIAISQYMYVGYAKYATAFQYVETDENDLTYFIIYILGLLRKALPELHRFLEKQTETLKNTESLIGSKMNFNNRQLNLLNHAMHHPNTRYTIKSYQISNNIVYQTARTDLLGLEKLELLVRRKIGKAFCFTPAENLDGRLRALK